MQSFIKIKEAINLLSDKTSKSYLTFILAQIQRLKEQKAPPEDAIAELIRLYDHIMEYPDTKSIWDPHPACSHVHVVMGDSFAGSMKQTLKALGWEEAHKIITIRDNYAIGPIGNLDSPEGRKKRNDWFRLHIADTLFDDGEDLEEEYTATLNKLKQIPERAEIIVWASRSVREQTGMRLALYWLRHAPNPIRVGDACSASDALFHRTDASGTYRRSGEIPPDQLKQVLMKSDSSRELSAADMEKGAAEWQAISEQGGVLRIWQNEAIREVPADYFDSFLLETLDQIRPAAGEQGFVKCARLIGEVLGRCEQDIDDSYLEYRVRELIYQGILEIRGIPAGMRFYSVRRHRRA